MKSYKNVELFAKNAPTGSYAAGCPTHHRQKAQYGSRNGWGTPPLISGECIIDDQGYSHTGYDMCSYCELFN